MSQYHEPVNELTAEGRNFVRALNSLKEEVEAINWYHQRVEACGDEALKAILAHNRDEEVEHAVMTLEWLRRNMPAWDEMMKTYLFQEGDVTELEESSESGESGGESDSSGLGIGSQRK